jgi:hypothetical protein
MTEYVSLFVQVYELFSKGNELLKVAIKLNIGQAQAIQYYSSQQQNLKECILNLDIMTLPKGYGPSGYRGGGGRGEGRDEIERMIGRRVENMKGIYILGFALCWAATAGGVYVGVTVYPWAYPLPSGLYALSVLTVIESLGFFFIMKITGEKAIRA